MTGKLLLREGRARRRRQNVVQGLRAVVEARLQALTMAQMSSAERGDIPN